MAEPAPPPSVDWPPDTRYLRFGEFRLDLAEARLLRGGETVELPARAFDVLLLLARSPHRLLTREAIFQGVWKNQIVEDSNLTQTIWLLRRALGDEEKRQIRTVAKRGYVFAPDQPVEAEPEPRSMVLPPSPVRVPDIAVAPAPAEPPGRRSPWLAAGITALVALMAFAVVWRLASAPSPAASVVIVDTPGSKGDGTAGDALVLARAWLEWKLSTLRQLEIAGDGAVPTDAVKSRRAVLLSSLQSAEGWRVDAQLFGGATALHFRQAGSGTDIAAGSDALTRQLVEAITGDADRDPPLDVVGEATTHFVAAQRADARGDRRTQVEELRKALAAAPSSGWLRLQLSDALAALGQIRAAAAVADQNREWIETLPPAVREILHAHWFAASQQFEEAVNAYVGLVERHPHLPGLRLALARVLIQDQHLRDAAQVLDAIDPASLPTEQHIEWLWLHVNFQFYQVSPQAAQATLRKIVELAADTPRFALDRIRAEGEARLMALRTSEKPASEADVAALEAIAARIAEAGAPAAAAKLRVDAAALRTTNDEGRLYARLTEMLAVTRAEGDVSRELLALASAGLTYGRNGDIARERELYREHEAVARTNGHVAGQRDAQKFLGLDALYAGRYDEAQQRLESVHGVLPAGQVGLGLAALYTAQGRYDEADRGSDDADSVLASSQHAPAQGAAPAAQLGVDCWRAETQYARGKLADAYLLYNACAAQSRQRVALAGRIGVARVDAASGKAEQARAEAAAAGKALAELIDVPARAQLSASLAQVLADLGEREAAREALRGAIDFARPNGLAPLEARARATAMQLALQEGELAAARDAYDAAMAVAPGTDWQVRSRLRLLHAALAGRTGDAGTQRSEAASIAADAVTHDDALVELAALSLAAEPGDRERDLVAQTGARGLLLRELARPR